MEDPNVLVDGSHQTPRSRISKDNMFIDEEAKDWLLKKEIRRQPYGGLSVEIEKTMIIAIYHTLFDK